MLAGSWGNMVRGVWAAMLFGLGLHAQSALRVIDWNIDRGKHLPAVVDALRRENPDLVLLQEVDSGTRRSGSVDVAAELARQLGLNYIFEPAFRELGQGGDAVQGQALLVRGAILQSRVLRFQQQSHFWKPQPYLPNWAFLQRRSGGRIALVAEVESAGRRVVVYNVHLESRGFGHTRDVQLEETIRDALRYPEGTPVVIGGDLNTLYGTAGVRKRLADAGFRNCFGDRAVRTHVLYGALDYIFVRGAIDCGDTTVVRGSNGSDHDFVSARITVSSPRNATRGGL